MPSILIFFFFANKFYRIIFAARLKTRPCRESSFQIGNITEEVRQGSPGGEHLKGLNINTG